MLLRNYLLSNSIFHILDGIINVVVAYETDAPSEWINQQSSTKLNSPNTMGHNNFLEPTLILKLKISVGHL
jgi:hypothetical protein